MGQNIGETILLAVIIVLAIYIIYQWNKMPPTMNQPSAPSPPAGGPVQTTEAVPAAQTADASGFAPAIETTPGTGARDYEKVTNKILETQVFNVGNSENMESAPDSARAVAECGCDPADPLVFAKNDFGAPGMDYKQYVTSQGVGKDVISNHQLFLRDFEKFYQSGTYFTGRTYSPDSHESYDPIPWIGLRRPKIPVGVNLIGSPAQWASAADNPEFYRANRSFCFWT